MAQTVTWFGLTGRGYSARTRTPATGLIRNVFTGSSDRADFNDAVKE
jgi:hypothetical protein